VIALYHQPGNAAGRSGTYPRTSDRHKDQALTRGETPLRRNQQRREQREEYQGSVAVRRRLDALPVREATEYADLRQIRKYNDSSVARKGEGEVQKVGGLITTEMEKGNELLRRLLTEERKMGKIKRQELEGGGEETTASMTLLYPTKKKTERLIESKEKRIRGKYQKEVREA